MSMQQIMKWGHDFLRIRGWGYSKGFGAMGKSQMSKGEPIKLSTTFLVLFTQSFITTRNWLSWLLHGMDKVWQPKFELEKPSVFGKRVLTPWASKNQKISSHSLMHPCLWSSQEISFMFGSFMCFFPHGWEVVFLTVSGHQRKFGI